MIQPRSGDRMQPTAQAVGSPRKLSKLRRSEREAPPCHPEAPSFGADGSMHPAVVAGCWGAPGLAAFARPGTSWTRNRAWRTPAPALPPIPLRTPAAPWKNGPSRAASERQKRKQFHSAERRCRRAKLAGNWGNHERRHLTCVPKGWPTSSSKFSSTSKINPNIV